MKYRILQSSVALLLICLLSSLAYGAQLEPHTAVTNTKFTLPDLNNQRHSLSDYKGNVVLVNFWASWCLPCVREMPELTQLKQRINRQSFEIITINVGERKNRVKHFAQRMNFELPVLLDVSSKVFNEWKVKIMPTSFLIDTNGIVRYRALGNPGWDDEQTLSIIENLIKETEKPVSTKQ